MKAWLGDGSAALLPRSSYDHISQALKEGRRFWEGEDGYGDMTWIRCDAVTMLQDVSPAGLKAFEDEEMARRLEEEGDG